MSNFFKPPREGYNEVGDNYPQWHWYNFWQVNEVPIVTNRLRSAFKQGAVAIDAGCGTGRYARVMKEIGYYVIGVDASEIMLSTAMRDASIDEAIRGDIWKINRDDESADVVLCVRTLSHVSDLNGTLIELSRLVKKNGRLLLADVHPDISRNGAEVTINVNGISVSIDGYRHPIVELKKQLKKLHGFTLICFEEIRACALYSRPSHPDFDALYAHDDMQIFWFSELVRDRIG